MSTLTEDNLLKKVAIYLSPGFIVGFMGFFLPFFYAMTPVAQANVCLCSFFQEKIENNRAFIMLTSNSFLFLEILNDVSYYSVNFLFIGGLIWMVYQIRHIKDHTLIKRECGSIVAWWTFLNII